MSATFRFHNFPARAGHKVEETNAMQQGSPTAFGWAEGGHMLRNADDLPLTYADQGFTDTATPVLVNPGVPVVGWREQMAYPVTEVDDWGAGPTKMAAAWPHAVQVVPMDADPVWFGTGHLIPSVTARVGNKRERQAREERRALHRLEVEGIVSLLGGCDRALYGSDWNCEPDYEDVDLLRQAGFKIVTLGPTHADGTIDWWIVRGLQVLDTRRLAPNGSDHRGIEIVVQ
jgi:hypothetical protein